MKITLNENDINDYSYTGPDFADDRIWVAAYTGDDGYTDLVVDSNICYVSTWVISDTTDEEYTEFPISEIDKAIELYNRDLERLGETGNLTRQEAEDVLADYGYYIDDYLPDGFYDRLKKSKNREETNKVFSDYEQIMRDRGEV